MTVTAEDSDTKQFRAAQISIGMFGVISQVTLRVQEKFKLKEFRSRRTLDYCLSNLDNLVRGDHKYVKMWIEFYNDFCLLYQTDATEDEITPLPWWLPHLTVSYITIIIFLINKITPSKDYKVVWLVFYCILT